MPTIVVGCVSLIIREGGSMRILVFALVSACLLAGATSCSQQSTVPTSSESGYFQKGKKAEGSIAAIQAQLVKMNITGWKSCRYPKWNCFQEVVVTPTNVTQADNLETAMSTGNLTTFFSSSSNYNTIWSSIPSGVLSDLQSGACLLQRTDSSTASLREYSCWDIYGYPIDYSAQ